MLHPWLVHGGVVSSQLILRIVSYSSIVCISFRILFILKEWQFEENVEKQLMITDLHETMEEGHNLTYLV